jgi:hypothetical protein
LVKERRNKHQFSGAGDGEKPKSQASPDKNMIAARPSIYLNSTVAGIHRSPLPPARFPWGHSLSAIRINYRYSGMMAFEMQAIRRDVEAAGFQLVAEGNFWRNPADAHDLPSYRPNMPFDNFVLKFQKPI